MVLTPSRMIELGTKAPDFKLRNVVSDKFDEFHDIAGQKGTVVMFICNHCPYVIHVRDEIVKMAKEYSEKGVGFVAISANDASHYPEDGPGKMAKLARDMNFSFPYLYDETQEVAKAYMAECTPDFFLFDNESLCVYRGRMDSATPGNDFPVNGSDLRSAIDQMLAGEKVSDDQYPSVGCNIKWIAVE